MVGGGRPKARRTCVEAATRLLSPKGLLLIKVAELDVRATVIIAQAMLDDAAGTNRSAAALATHEQDHYDTPIARELGLIAERSVEIQ